MVNRWSKVVLLVVLSLLVVFSGCAGRQPAGPSGGGGTLVVVKNHDADGLDPHRAPALVSREIYSLLYDRLVYMDASGEPRPWLAESWQVSGDGKEITFKLREGVKFHDGTEVDAEAVRFTFERMRDPALKSTAAAQFPGIKSVDVLDKYTVRFVLEKPFAPIFNSLASPFGSIISPTAVKKLGDEFNRKPVGSGPFKFESWTPGTEIVLVRNPDYKCFREDLENKGAPYVDKVVFRIIPEEGTKANAIQAGEVHIIPVAYAQADYLKKVPGLHLVAIEKGFNMNYIEFNTRKPPFDDVRVRKAVGYALDPAEIAQAAYLGYATVNRTPLPTGVAGYDESIGQQFGFTRDLDRARQLLAEAGFKDADGDGVVEKAGKPLEVTLLSWTSPYVQRVCETIQGQLAEVGIKVKVDLMEAGTFLAKGKEGVQHFDFMRTTWAEPLILSRMFKGGGVFQNFSSPELEALLDRAATTVDWEQRKAALRDIQKYLLENALMVPLLTDHVLYFVRDEVTGYKIDTLGFDMFNDVRIGQK